MDIAFDIETIPNSRMTDRLPPIEVKAGNLKDPAKIAEKEAAAKAEQIEKMALSPLYGRICAWVAGDDLKDFYSIKRDIITKDSDAEETRIIESAFSTLSGKRMITYNGNGFDLPFLYRRAVLLGIDPREYGMPTLADTRYYGNKYHIDLMHVWCGFGNYEKLDNIAGAMLNDHKIEVDFRNFKEMIKTPEGRIELLDYCQQDVILTMKLWNRIAGILI